MNSECKLSNMTMTYLKDFNCILEKMIAGMTDAVLSESISHNFIVQMIPHHEAAIEMSENILKYTENPPLIQIAQGIIEEQTKSIGDMRRILYSCSELKDSESDVCRYQTKINEIMEVMFFRMENARATNSLNCNFMWEMIPHHRGAVEMSETTLKYCICEELKPILEAIISSQKKGIARMQKLLCCLGC